MIWLVLDLGILMAAIAAHSSDTLIMVAFIAFYAIVGDYK